MTASGGRDDRIDGLRAIAMTMVVAQHCGLLPFGWTGVWLFYVISGYVITRGLLATSEGAVPTSVRYSEFLWRRFLRIVPVYLLYLLINAVLLTSLNGRGKLSDLPYLLSFTYNWHMIFDFWPGNSGWAPFGHLWTLSVEQQFYLIFPLLALLLPERWQTRVMLALVCLGPLLRWQWSAWMQAQGSPPGHVAFAVYASTHCHFDAFLMGALVARWQLRGQALPAIATEVGLAALLVAVVYAGFYVNGNHDAGQLGVQVLRNVYSGILYGGGREVWVYLAVDLLAAAVLMHLILRRAGTAWLGFRPLAWVGRVSYGGYLFHVLVLWTFGAWLNDSISPMTVPDRLALFIGVWCVTVGLATVSFRWFEEPLARHWRNRAKTARTTGTVRRQANA